MVALKISILEAILCCLVLGDHLVHLKSPSSLGKLLDKDDQYKKSKAIRPLIKKVFSFGDFECFLGDFPQEIIERLKLSPYVADVIPDFVVNKSPTINIKSFDDKNAPSFKNESLLPDPYFYNLPLSVSPSSKNAQKDPCKMAYDERLEKYGPSGEAYCFSRMVKKGLFNKKIEGTKLSNLNTTSVNTNKFDSNLNAASIDFLDDEDYEKSRSALETLNHKVITGSGIRLVLNESRPNDGTRIENLLESRCETPLSLNNSSIDTNNGVNYENTTTSLGIMDYKNPIDVIIQSSISETVKSYETQICAPRHLSRISRKTRLPFNESTNYYFDGNFKGKDVHAYIIDTGIKKDHPDFEGRAIFGADFTLEGPGDTNGHGTHVAGVVGSKTYGVAKEVTLVEVKSLDNLGQGSLASVISGLEFAVKDMKKRGVKAVANLSLGANKNAILDKAISAAVDSGLLVVVAAGNSNIDACLTSPASSSKAITVGALDDVTDAIAPFSNWGECVDIFSSGVKVSSLSINSFDKPYTISGTSMASPSVAGMGAILLEMGIPVDNIKKKLSELATYHLMHSRSFFGRPYTPNKITNNGVSKNKDDDFYDNPPPYELEYEFEDLYFHNKPKKEILFTGKSSKVEEFDDNDPDEDKNIVDESDFFL